MLIIEHLYVYMCVYECRYKNIDDWIATYLYYNLLDKTYIMSRFIDQTYHMYTVKLMLCLLFVVTKLYKDRLQVTIIVTCVYIYWCLNVPIIFTRGVLYYDLLNYVAKSN